MKMIDTRFVLAAIALAIGSLAADGPKDPPVDGKAAAAAAAGDRRPELVPLTGLNSDRMESGPWPTGDGLTLYWTVFQNRLPPAIWSSARPGPDAPFNKPERLFLGAYPTLTSDGLLMVLSRRGALWMSRRSSVNEPFARPAAIPELQDESYCRRSCLSEDGLSLYYERLREGHRGVELRVTRRLSASAPWGTPKRLEIDLARAGASRPAGPFVFRKGTALLCADDRRAGEGTSNFMLWTKSRPDGPFDTFEYLEFDGLKAFGYCPRYVESTGELFFNSGRSSREMPEERGHDLYSIKNVRLRLPDAPK